MSAHATENIRAEELIEIVLSITENADTRERAQRDYVNDIEDVLENYVWKIAEYMGLTYDEANAMIMDRAAAR